MKEAFYALQSRCIVEKLTTDSRLINLANGIYNWVEDKLYFHGDNDSQHLFIYQLPVNFNPRAKCPRIMQFLNEVMRPEDIRAL